MIGSTERRITFSLILLLVLAAITQSFAAPHPKNLIQVFMLNTGVDPDARGRVMLVQNKAQTHFKIKVSDLAPGVYDVIVDGAVYPGEITAGSEGNGMVKHRVLHRGAHAGGTLPYDPRGALVEIAATGGGPVLLRADVPATPADSGAVIQVEIDLTNAGVQPGAYAQAEFKSRYGRMKFEVEADGMIPGTYDLYVGGVDVADLVVAAGGRGAVAFDSRPTSDDDGAGDALDLLLTFDPRGQLIEIREQGTGMVLFSGTL